MTEFMLDTNNSQLFIGRPAYEQAVETGAVDPRDAVNLATLIATSTRTDQFCTETLIDTTNYTREDCITDARWLLTLLASHEASTGQTVLPREYHLRHLSQLGLTASLKRLQLRSEMNTGALFQEAGAEQGYFRGQFDQWTDQDYIQLARELETERLAKGLHGRPTRPDFLKAARSGRGPGIKKINTEQGGVLQLTEKIGYLDVTALDETGYLQWGVKAWRANGGVLNRTIVNALSARDKGPALRTFYDYFDSLPRFADMVRQQAAAELKIEQEHRHAIEREMTQRLVAGALPSELMRTDDAVIAYALFNLASRLLRGSPRTQIIRVSLLKPGEFMSAVSTMCDVTKERIETLSVKLGYTHLLWQDREYMHDLRVSATEIEEQRKKYRLYTARSKAAAQRKNATA